MLQIRLKTGWALKLDRKLSEAGGYGIWEFHRSESTFTRDNGHTTYRYARLRPADPAEGKLVEVTLMPSPSAPEDVWVERGEGIAEIHPAY
ncbi:hypothetical protein LLE81_00020 [Staphylococcus epidermidis]|nr:hypothetical protein [Staphylococcus epidermidis]